MCTQLAQYQLATNQQNASTSPQASAQVQAGGSIQAGASALSALGALAQGVMQSRILNAEADAARQIGQQRAQRIRTAGGRVLSSARSDAVGAGVSVRSDSVLEAERAIVRNVEQDAGIAIINGNSQASSLETSADYAKAGGLQAFGDGVLSAADKWKRSRRADVTYRAGDPYSNPLYVGGMEGE